MQTICGGASGSLFARARFVVSRSSRNAAMNGGQIYPKNGSRSSLELVIFFKVKLLAAIDDFTIWVRCGAVENR
jgi:hypothetical protein